jgi:DNA replication protein DnaC
LPLLLISIFEYSFSICLLPFSILFDIISHHFPEYKPLDDFDLSEQQSLSKKQLKQLQELIWLEQAYNLILLGPPGVGKTCLSIGLGIEAISRGYRVTFVQMDELIRLLKTEEISRNSRAKVKRMVSSDLVIIDDLMFMAIDRHEANLFFQLINKLYGQTSIIITSNKGPEDWGDILGDPAITTAILDRLIHKSEVIHLSGDSYRLKHRQTIFGNN